MLMLPVSAHALNPTCLRDYGVQGDWGHHFFTPAAQHSDAHYHYLIHGIPEWRLDKASLSWIYDQMPDAIALSMSVIDEQKNPTWSAFGFIFDTPKAAQVLVTSSGDASTPRVPRPKSAIQKFFSRFDKAEFAKTYRQKLEAEFSDKPILSPEALLAANNLFMHNEVLIGGPELTSESMPKVTAIFYKISKKTGQSEVTPDVLEQLQKLARKKNLPLIPLKDTGHGH